MIIWFFETLSSSISPNQLQSNVQICKFIDMVDLLSYVPYPRLCCSASVYVSSYRRQTECYWLEPETTRTSRMISMLASNVITTAARKGDTARSSKPPIKAFYLTWIAWCAWPSLSYAGMDKDCKSWERMQHL